MHSSDNTRQIEPVAERLLLILPLHAYRVGEKIFIDAQACNGLRLWLKNFRFVTLMCPMELCLRSPASTLPLESIDGIDRMAFFGLPTAYAPVKFFANLPEVMRLLSKQISVANYSHFAIGGLWGDWASVASIIASRAGIPFAVWTDRVEFSGKVLRRSVKGWYATIIHAFNCATNHVLRAVYHCALFVRSISWNGLL